MSLGMKSDLLYHTLELCVSISDKVVKEKQHFYFCYYSADTGELLFAPLKAERTEGMLCSDCYVPVVIAYLDPPAAQPGWIKGLSVDVTRPPLATLEVLAVNVAGADEM